jgi:hypothetical protein
MEEGSLPGVRRNTAATAAGSDFQIEKRGGGTEEKEPGARRRRPADMAGDDRGAGAFRVSLWLLHSSLGWAVGHWAKLVPERTAIRLHGPDEVGPG